MEVKSISIQNFKGIKDLSVNFGKVTTIKGQNAAGKTTIADSFSWLMFNCDSHGDTKFEIRPLDANGEKIHNTEITVSAVLVVDGKDVELKKVQSEKWTKKRGHEDRAFEGNVNEYSIDDYPKSEKEYNAYIASLVDTDVFKMITNPTYFTALPWKEQRAVLMRFVADMSDVELAQGNPDFAELLSEIEKALSTDDIQKKYAKAIKDLKAKQTEIPTRIDEVSKQKVDYDIAELELAKSEYERQLADLENKSPNTDTDSLYAELEAAKKAVYERQCIIRDNFNAEQYKIDSELREATRQANDLLIKRDEMKRTLEKAQSDLAADTTERDEIGNQYKSVQAETFRGVLDFNEADWTDIPSTKCKVCGQELPPEQADKIISEFEERKAVAKADAEKRFAADREAFQGRKQRRLDELKGRGLELKARIDKAQEYIKTAPSEIADLETQAAALNQTCDNLREQLAAMGNEPNYDADSDYVRLKAAENEIAEKLSAATPKAENDTVEKRTGVQAQLDEVKAKLAQAANNLTIDDRIAELETELREVSQKIADAEKMLYLLEKFVRAKLDRVSEAVNSHFKMVRFKLFEYQINGGIKETCEAEVEGVPFSSLNTGHRILVGLDIINALSELYGVQASIWLDNAESLSEGNLPTMAQQMILLEVSNDKDLKVEVSE